eukprot:gnl/MRDRNA2_/MRDRNA2_192260_c0_seq1.p1 gnl/MRDRNA2_/MRDRNA2_192260_c0~~gnl/MRDRNA2_/MRDRNA2_192260_c0_seq1.p1  ORF type:complete len:218 (-),score=41.20 gnl/MRDRNA2_/MRDRNA2_192260_c0_seq1:29-682(-)
MSSGLQRCTQAFFCVDSRLNKCLEAKEISFRPTPPEFVLVLEDDVTLVQHFSSVLSDLILATKKLDPWDIARFWVSGGTRKLLKAKDSEPPIGKTAGICHNASLVYRAHAHYFGNLGVLYRASAIPSLLKRLRTTRINDYDGMISWGSLRPRSILVDPSPAILAHSEIGAISNIPKTANETRRANRYLELLHDAGEDVKKHAQLLKKVVKEIPDKRL